MKSVVLGLLCACGVVLQASQSDPAAFRVIGYYSLRAAMTADVSTVPFDRLTHVNLSFLNPTPAGESLALAEEARTQRDRDLTQRTRRSQRFWGEELFPNKVFPQRLA